MLRFISDVGLPNVKFHLDSFRMIREEDDFAESVHETGNLLGCVRACEKHRDIPSRARFRGAPFSSFGRCQLSGNCHDRIFRSGYGAHRQTLLYLAKASGFARAACHGRAAFPEDVTVNARISGLASIF